MNKDRIIQDLREKLEEAEEEIEYNVRRKEELKDKIESLEKQLRGARDMYSSYMDQCKNLADRNRELEERISSISLEKCKLAEQNRIKAEELSKLKTQNKSLITNNIKSIEALQDDLKTLEKKKESDKQEYSEEVGKAKERIRNLEIEIATFLKCEYCAQVFSDKENLQTHIESLHLVNKQNRKENKGVKCKECGKPFYTKDDLQRHIIAKHKLTISKEKALQKLDNIQVQLSQQRRIIFDKLLLLRDRELKIRAKCMCKGICKIQHFKYRWSKSDSDKYSKQVTKLSENSTTKVQFRIHSSENLKFKCDQCELNYKSLELLKNHKQDIHKDKSLKSILKKS